MLDYPRPGNFKSKNGAQSLDLTCFDSCQNGSKPLTTRTKPQLSKMFSYCWNVLVVRELIWSLFGNMCNGKAWCGHSNDVCVCACACACVCVVYTLNSDQIQHKHEPLLQSSSADSIEPVSILTSSPRQAVRANKTDERLSWRTDERTGFLGCLGSPRLDFVFRTFRMSRQEFGGRTFQGIPHWVPGAPQPQAVENDPAAQLFDHFCAANTFQTIMSTFQQLCDLLDLKPSDHRNFYRQLKSRLTSWKAQSLWSKLDKRAAHREYRKGQVCANNRVSSRFHWIFLSASERQSRCLCCEGLDSSRDKKQSVCSWQFVKLGAITCGIA